MFTIWGKPGEKLVTSDSSALVFDLSLQHCRPSGPFCGYLGESGTSGTKIKKPKARDGINKLNIVRPKIRTLPKDEFKNHSMSNVKKRGQHFVTS